MNSVNPSTSVLIVDDTSTSREAVRSMLTDMGIRTIAEAATGEQALEKLHTQRFSLIISDFMMASMHGLELLMKVRKDPLLSGIPFILVSSVRESTFVEDALEMGATSYIRRPLEFDALSQQVLQALGTKPA